MSAIRVVGVGIPMAGGGYESNFDEDDGWLVSCTANVAEDRSELVVLDAKNVAAGPIARARSRAPARAAQP